MENKTCLKLPTSYVTSMGLEPTCLFKPTMGLGATIITQQPNVDHQTWTINRGLLPTPRIDHIDLGHIYQHQPHILVERFRTLNLNNDIWVPIRRLSHSHPDVFFTRMIIPWIVVTNPYAYIIIYHYIST